MQYFISQEPVIQCQDDCLIIGIYEQGELSNSAQKVDQHCQGLIRRLFERGDITGKAGQLLLLHDVNALHSPRLLLAGMGKKDQVTEQDLHSTMKAVAQTLNDSGAASATSYLPEIHVQDRSQAWHISQSIIAIASALYQYEHTKSDLKKTDTPLSTFRFVSTSPEAESALKTGQAMAAGMNLARDLGNLPGNICTPSYLAEQAQALDSEYERITTTILEEEEMETLGMGALLSVSRGSREPAKLITVKYQGADDARPIVLVGKGLTFDAGGISLKPAQGMDEMKYDMCGGASVLGTLAAVAQLNLPVNVVGVIPSSENLPDGQANKPGDIVTSMAGKTIEILNTDAEGRLILCDALTYSARFNPEIVIDIATLTGAIIVALGNQATGLMTNDQALASALIAAGHDSFDRVWQLPLWQEYQKQLDSHFADIANVGGKEAGSVTAACFLSRFTQDYTWAHLDIAGTAWNSGKNKGATGRPVPLLVQFLLNHINAH